MPPLLANDVLLVKILCGDCRFLNRRQIEFIYGRDRRRTNERLLNLLKRGYLDRRYLLSSYESFKSPLYFLGKKGADLAGMKPGAYRQLREIVRQTAERAIPHILRVYDVYLKFLLGTVVEKWLWFNDPGLTEIDMGVVPDAYVQYKDPAVRYEAFIEVDRGTESRPKLEERLWKYQEFYRSGGFRNRYGGCGFRVLIFTEEVRDLRLPSENFWMAKTAEFLEKPINDRLFKSVGEMHSLFEKQEKESLPTEAENAQRTLQEKRREQEAMEREVREAQIRAAQEKALRARRERHQRMLHILKAASIALGAGVTVWLVWTGLLYLFRAAASQADTLIAEAKQLFTLGILFAVVMFVFVRQ